MIRFGLAIFFLSLLYITGIPMFQLLRIQNIFFGVRYESSRKSYETGLFRYDKKIKVSS